MEESQLGLKLRSRSRPRPGPSITASSSTTTALDTITERRIENITEGLPSQCLNFLHRMLPANKENVLTICDYISSLKSEINPSDNYRRDTIVSLCIFSTFFKNAKPFKEIAREDVLSFLDSFRKIKSVDPLHCISGLEPIICTGYI